MNSIKNKDQLVTFLKIIQMNLFLSKLCLTNVTQESFTEIMEIKDSEGIVEHEVLNDLKKFKEKDISFEMLIDNCHRSFSRLFLREVFEVVKLYCENTRQKKIFYNWEYCNFFRVQRNCISHGLGGYLSKWPDDLYKKKILTVSWKNLTLREEDIKLEKEIGLGYTATIMAFNDYLDFTKKQ